MEALGLAAGICRTRETGSWKGIVKWYVDTMGDISSFWTMPGSAANDWSKMWETKTCLGILILCRVKYCGRVGYDTPGGICRDAKER